MFDIHPALFLLLGAIPLAFLPRKIGYFWLVALPFLSLINLLGFELGDSIKTTYLGLDLEILRYDRIGRMFAILFHIAGIIGAIYSIHVKDKVALLTGAMYAASAVGVVLAGDLLTLFLWWEGLAVTSVFQIWARKSKRSGASGTRYLIMHVLSGLLLLGGVATIYSQTKSLELTNLSLENGIGAWLVLAAIGIKCAFPFVHTWLVDSYPESTPAGTLFLASFTTKAAVCILARCFPGESLLVYIGAMMAMFPIFFAVIENDLRRVLGYSMINQIGFMVVGIGIGTPLALNGAVAHAFNDVLFKGLLMMTMGAVLFRTGRMNGSELGGLYKSMPITAIFCIIGAASISAFPLFSGFTSKSMIMSAAAVSGSSWTFLYIVWFILLFAAAGVFHHAGIKIPFFAFFAHDSGIRCKEAPKSMLVAMGIAAFFCVFNGCFPNLLLYKLLPGNNAAGEIHLVHEAHWLMTEGAYHPYSRDHIITQTQLLFFSALAFVFLMLKGIYPPELRSTNLDVDWFYRKGARLFQNVMAKFWNGLNDFTKQIFQGDIIPAVSNFSESGPSKAYSALLSPFWEKKSSSKKESEILKKKFFTQSRLGAFALGITACLGAVVFILLFFL